MYIEMIKRKKGKTFFVSTFLDCYMTATYLKQNFEEMYVFRKINFE